MLLITRLEAQQVLDAIKQAQEDPYEDIDFDDSVEILQGVLEQVDMPLSVLCPDAGVEY